MKKLILIAASILIASCSKDDNETSCKCETVKDRDGVKVLQIAKLCGDGDVLFWDIDYSGDVPMIKNKSEEQLRANAITQGCR